MKKLVRPYFPVSDDTIYDARNLLIRFSHVGIHLICQYYANKYQANISRLLANSDPYKDKNMADNSPHFLYFNSDGISSLNHYLSNIRQTKKDHREAFIFGNGYQHGTLITYIKEYEQEYILFLDSLGMSGADTSCIINLEKVLGLPVYVVAMARQKDMHSCYNDALLLGRDLTAFDPEEQKFFIPNLLQRLNVTLDSKRNLKICTQLPDELLKTTQISAFVQTYREPDQTRLLYKKKQSLNFFREVYTDKNSHILKTDIDGNSTVVEANISNYLRVKSIKFADIVEIQFYINEIEIKRKLSANEKAQFISEAKDELKKQGSVSNNYNRAGLYEWSIGFLERIKNQELASSHKPLQH